MRRSAIADAAALRLEESMAAEIGQEFEPGPRVAPARPPVVHSCAMAEGAALRWLERQPSEPELW